MPVTDTLYKDRSEVQSAIIDCVFENLIGEISTMYVFRSQLVIGDSNPQTKNFVANVSPNASNIYAFDAQIDLINVYMQHNQGKQGGCF